eukprot:TRINITY_DN3820_c0_g1_i3.p1 TRINITY_DN3820_c0_g1~~TRINITY_DN3820_c0_g1_i3.p1  ORF type:complete len:323 (+),score=23.89 TRINITY_DN3820_c0_g1_i3:3-971(+)
MDDLISYLPNETQCLIYNSVFSKSDKQFSKVLRVCKQWYHNCWAMLSTLSVMDSSMNSLEKKQLKELFKYVINTKNNKNITSNPFYSPISHIELMKLKLDADHDSATVEEILSFFPSLTKISAHNSIIELPSSSSTLQELHYNECEITGTSTRMDMSKLMNLRLLEITGSFRSLGTDGIRVVIGPEGCNLRHICTLDEDIIIENIEAVANQLELVGFIDFEEVSIFSNLRSLTLMSADSSKTVLPSFHHLKDKLEYMYILGYTIESPDFSSFIKLDEITILRCSHEDPLILPICTRSLEVYHLLCTISHYSIDLTLCNYLPP